jgi:hypothetical protein
MFLHEALEEMVSQGMIAESEMNSALSRTNRYTQMQKDSTVTVECDTDYRPINKAKEEKMRQDRAVEALTKQYAPDEDTAWQWMRKAHEMGFTWGHNVLQGGPTASDPLGQRSRPKQGIAMSFSDGSVHVGITLVAGAVRWAWFTDMEWGEDGRSLVLAAKRNHYPDPVAAIADWTLSGQKVAPPRPGKLIRSIATTTTHDDAADVLSGVFGEGWGDD